MTVKFSVSAGALRVTLIVAASFLLVAAGDVPAPLSIPAVATAADLTTIDAAVTAATTDDTATGTATIRPARLDTMVGDMQGSVDADDDADLRCLATAVYFEARGEPLEGQLAVAQSILNRVATGRYAASVCGVIHQPGQYSFSRAKAPRSGNDWQIALAIAAIAQDNGWREVAPKATSFHAAYVKPGWGRMTKVAQIGNHVFYR